MKMLTKKIQGNSNFLFSVLRKQPINTLIQSKNCSEHFLLRVKFVTNS